MQAIRRAATATACAVTALLVGTAPAMAGTEMGQSPPGGGSGPRDQIASKVHFTVSNPGSGGSSLTPIGGGDWKPPSCWYQPKYTPKQFEDYLASHDYGNGSAGHEMGKDYGEDDFHKGDKGAWWELVGTTDTDLAAYGECAMDKDSYLWIGPEDPPPPDTPVIDPQVLAGLAYDRTKLPAPPVKLSPPAGKQVVNLDTYVSFAQNLDRVWVTAEFNAMGVNVAATTVATPVKLHIDAGTDNAQPRSCTYDLVKKGGAFGVDSKGSGCNITYRRQSGDSTYGLQASITWKVTWTDSADPDGPARQPGMPDGESTVEQDVTVKEVQAINR